MLFSGLFWLHDDYYLSCVGLLHATLVHYVDSGSGKSSTVHDCIADIRALHSRTQREIILKYRIAQLKFIREPDSTAMQHSRST